METCEWCAEQYDGIRILIIDAINTKHISYCSEKCMWLDHFMNYKEEHAID